MLLIQLTLPAFAEGTPKIYGENISCKSGDTVTYHVYISGNPGIAGFLVSASCDNDWLYFDDDVTQGDFSAEGTITSSHDIRMNNALWFNADNVSGNGTLFSFTVHISPSAPDGEYPITVAVSDKNTLNDTYQQVNFEVNSGSITVTHIDNDITPETQEKNADWRLWAIIGAVGVFGIIGIIVVSCKLLKKRK